MTLPLHADTLVQPTISGRVASFVYSDASPTSYAVIASGYTGPYTSIFAQTSKTSGAGGPMGGPGYIQHTDGFLEFPVATLQSLAPFSQVFLNFGWENHTAINGLAISVEGFGDDGIIDAGDFLESSTTLISRTLNPNQSEVINVDITNFVNNALASGDPEIALRFTLNDDYLPNGAVAAFSGVGLNVVPEPNAAAVLLLGGSALLCRRRIRP